MDRAEVPVDRPAPDSARAERLAGPFVRLAAGTSGVGSDAHYPEERPARVVEVAAFRLAVHPVTVGQFARFVQATRYVTDAERHGAAAVFVAPAGPVDRAHPQQWWRLVEGATWLAPFGPNARRRPAPDEPVVQVTAADAAAFCRWAQVRLATEAEWERAAAATTLPPTWPFAPDGQLGANVWIGEFPWRHDRASRPGPQAVGRYGTDAVGCVDLLGNVWEWTATRWASSAPGDDRRVIKGGSFLCSADYCTRYRPSARLARSGSEPACHVGLRVALDA